MKLLHHYSHWDSERGKRCHHYYSHAKHGNIKSSSFLDLLHYKRSGGQTSNSVKQNGTSEYFLGHIGASASANTIGVAMTNTTNTTTSPTVFNCPKLNKLSLRLERLLRQRLRHI